MFQSIFSEGKTDHNPSDMTSNREKHKEEGKSVSNLHQNAQTILVLKSS